MSAPALTHVGRPTLQIRGTPYPIVLPSLRDSRLHLAAVIVSLQVLGQVAFDFRLSIAQILVAVLTCAVLEIGIAFQRQRVILWPASALLTGNGVAFILRVPGTEHGDWWSLRGAWIFAGTAAVALLSKYLLRFRGRHIFNPSNFGLVLCFLALGKDRADPLDFWWAPMSPWLASALALIVAGGFVILWRLRLLEIAVGFWLAFAAGLSVLAASGHAMTARWHLGPISDAHFWWVLVSSPEVIVFLFFMITDPKTIPGGRFGRRAYAVGIGLVATLLIAPLSTEFATKVALLGALALVCAAWPVVELVAGARFWLGASTWRHRQGRGATRRAAVGALALAGVAGFVGLVVLAGGPARSSAQAARAPTGNAAALPRVTIGPSADVASQLSRATALRIAEDLVADLRSATAALRRRDSERAATGAAGDWLAELRRQIRAASGRAILVPAYRVERLRLTLERGEGQEPPTIVATVVGTVERTTYGRSSAVADRSDREGFMRTFELALAGDRYLIVRSRDAGARAPMTPAVVNYGDGSETRLTDVAATWIVGAD